MKQKTLLKLKATLNRFIVKAKHKTTFIESIENKRPYNKMFNIVKEGIYGQAVSVADIRILKKITKLLYKIDIESKNKIRLILSEVWKPATTFIDKREILKYFIWVGNLSGQKTTENLGFDGNFKLVNKPLLNKMKKRANWLLKSMDVKALDDLVNTVTGGIEKELTPYEIKNLIHIKYKKDISPFRADMIVRTELNNSASLVQYESYRHNGVKKIEWITAGEECPNCADLDGKKVKVGTYFDGPLGPVLRPPYHPNCRCDTVAIIDTRGMVVKPWLGK